MMQARGGRWMKPIIVLSMLIAAMAAIPLAFAMPPPVGQAAPDFSATDTNGGTQALRAYRGKIVVLEWSNPDCPYVHKHYDSHAMQKLQDEALGQGIIWLTIVSSAPGRDGYMNAVDANEYKAKMSSHAVRILDPDGRLGRLYGATATPDMYVIDKTGVLVYEGAIDTMPTTRPESLSIADNYVRDALADLAAGRPLRESVTQPYGCSVKYAE